jgi:hypothetical protein
MVVLEIFWVNLTPFSLSKAQQTVIMARGKADATLIQMEAEANGQFEILSKQVHRYPMPLTSSECQVSELVNSDACPRPTTFKCLNWSTVTRAHIPRHASV